MKQFWQEFCLQAYVRRFELWAVVLVIAAWAVLAGWVLPKQVLDAIVYFSFGWFVLGDICVPWTTNKLNKLFN